jgi:signal transduction histidine kinase
MRKRLSGRLLIKLMTAMAMVVIFGGLCSAFIIGYSTRLAFRSVIRENDLRFSSIYAPIFAEYYQRRGSWDGVEEYLSNRQMQMPGARMGRSFTPPLSMGITGNGHMTGPMRDSGVAKPMRIVLLDAAGKIRLNIPREGADDPSVRKPVRNLVAEEGTVINLGETEVGRLYVGSMIEPVFNPLYRRFLDGVYRSILLATGMMALLALVVAAMLFRHIMRPLERLTRATKEMERGNYEILVDTGRTDELGDLSRSFASMAGVLRESDRWKRRLIADSAHELRTPVAILQGNLEMIRDGVYPPDEEHLERLHEEALLLSRLVEELGRLSDAQKGAASYRFEELDAGELVRKTVSKFHAKLAEKSLVAELEAETSPLPLFADAQKCVQALSNLISNAIGHAPEKSKVLIVLEAGQEFVRIAVEDEGSGIAKEERERVFERFYRVDSARNRADGGSGLGLSVVKEIMKNHGGRVFAEPGKKLSGARFVLQFPVSGELLEVKAHYEKANELKDSHSAD